MSLLVKVKVSLFADDIMFFSSDKYKRKTILYLQWQLSLISNWFSDWRMKINEFKIIAVLYSSIWTKIYSLLSSKQLINRNGLIRLNTLGSSSPNFLKFSQHITHIVNKASIMRGTFYTILNSSSFIPMRMCEYNYSKCMSTQYATRQK